MVERWGFNTRKDFINHRKDGPITLKEFVCSNESCRTSDNRNCEVKRLGAEIQTRCLICFSLKPIRQTQKYKVNDFFGNHNHILQRPESVDLMSLK
jgi:FAR1 DNA-binding domain